MVVWLIRSQVITTYYNTPLLWHWHTLLGLNAGFKQEIFMSCTDTLHLIWTICWKWLKIYIFQWVCVMVTGLSCYMVDPGHVCRVVEAVTCFQTIMYGQLQPEFLQRNIVGLCVHTGDWIQYCGYRPIAVGWYLMLCHTQCIHSPVQSKQWPATGSPLPTSYGYSRGDTHALGF